MHFIDQAPTSNRNKATSAMKTFSVLLAFILVALGFESRAAAPTPTNTLITTNIPITTNVTSGYFLVHVPVSGSSLGLRQASLAVVSAAIGGGGVSLATVTNIVVGITQPQSNSLRTLTLQVGLANTNYTTAVSNSLYSLAYALDASGTNNVTSLSNAIIAYVNANSSITNAVGGAGQYQLLLGNKLRRLEFTGDATVTTNGDLISVDVTAGAGASNAINGAQATNIFVDLATASNWATVTYAQSLTNPMATTAFVNSALASYTPLTLATNLRTLVVLTSSGATSISTNSGQITLTINTNVSGGGGISGSDATNIFTGLAIASNWLATSTFNTSTSAIVGLIDSRSTALSNYTASAFLTNANNVQQRLITNQSVKTFSAGSNMTITDQGTNLVLAASLSGGAASLSDVTNIVEELSVLQNNGTGTGTTLVNPTIIGGSLTNTFRSLKPVRLLILGDSQTDEGGLPGYYNWFSQYIWPRGRINATNRFSAVNVAEAGQTYASELVEDEGRRFRPLGTNENGYVIIALGINDLIAGSTAFQTATNMTNLVNLYKTNGWKVIVGDLVGTNYLTNTVGALAEAVEFNTILSNTWAGGFIDHLVQQSTNTAITTSDGLHPNNAGAAAQAVQWALTLDPLMNEGSFDYGRSWLGTTYFQAAKSNYAAVRMSGGYMEMVEPAHLRWGGTYGASRYITAASTNNLDELYIGTYARDTIILSGDGASSRVGIRKRPDSGYALDVSGFAKVTALIATNQVEGILRGKSGSISTNTGIVQALYIYDEAPLVFLREGTNYTWTGVQDNAWNNIFTAGSRSTGDYGIATANGRILFGFNGRTPHWYLSRTNLTTPWVSMGSQGAGSAIGAGDNDFVMRIRDFTPGASFTNRAHIAVGDSGTAQVIVNTNNVEMLLWPGGQELRSMPLTNAAAFQAASSALTALSTNNASALTNYHQTNLVAGLQTWLAIPASIPMQRGMVPNPIMVQTNASATITSWVPVSGLPSNAYLAISNSSGGNITITTTGTGRFIGTATNSLVIGSGKFGFIYVESFAGASTNIMGTVVQQ